MSISAVHFRIRCGISVCVSCRCSEKSTPNVVIRLSIVLCPHSQCNVSKHFLWLDIPHCNSKCAISKAVYTCVYTQNICHILFYYIYTYSWTMILSFHAYITIMHKVFLDKSFWLLQFWDIILIWGHDHLSTGCWYLYKHDTRVKVGGDQRIPWSKMAACDLESKLIISSENSLKRSCWPVFKM